MATSSSQYSHHKGYRFIALIFKIIAGIVFPIIFAKLTMPMKYLPQTVGSFLSNLSTLVVYYGLIFVLNRYRNFSSRPPLGKTVAVYILFILAFMALESSYAGVIQNLMYKVTGLEYQDNVISIATVNNPFVYQLFGTIVHFVFGYITGIFIFIMFKYVLTDEDKLAKI